MDDNKKLYEVVGFCRGLYRSEDVKDEDGKVVVSNNLLFSGASLNNLITFLAGSRYTDEEYLTRNNYYFTLEYMCMVVGYYVAEGLIKDNLLFKDMLLSSCVRENERDNAYFIQYMISLLRHMTIPDDYSFQEPKEVEGLTLDKDFAQRLMARNPK